MSVKGAGQALEPRNWGWETAALGPFLGAPITAMRKDSAATKEAIQNDQNAAAEAERQAANAAAAEDEKMRRRRGRANTIMGGGMGVPGQAPVLKTILGG